MSPIHIRDEHNFNQTACSQPVLFRIDTMPAGTATLLITCRRCLRAVRA